MSENPNVKKTGMQAGAENHQTQYDVLQMLINFLRSIGLHASITQYEQDCFLPGLAIKNGELLINTAANFYPGDILHEAGHLAVIPAAERATADAEMIAQRPQRDAEEMMAICWSYAACVHLGLPASFVFHNDGYKGAGTSLAENFEGGYFIGLPMLQWIGLAYDEQRAAEVGAPPFPAMRQWLRD
ncbi:MAG: hypothetical protein EOO03_02750 [Chitinophagaceae bacterium]|nr:MAG: hypothetical protein EOO03_02750 [Chitinophagaceae bacterium]